MCCTIRVNNTEWVFFHKEIIYFWNNLLKNLTNANKIMVILSSSILSYFFIIPNNENCSEKCFKVLAYSTCFLLGLVWFGFFV